MKINLNIKKSVFLPVYFPYVFDYSKRYNIYWGGRSSGKTFFIVLKLLLKGLKEKRNILLMKKTTASVKDSVWKELNEAIDRFNLRPYFTFNQTEYRAIFKLNGTEFHCTGLDVAEKIKGYSEISDVYLDEATAFTADDLDLIDGTVRSIKYKLPLQLYYSFNPVSKANFIYKYFHFDTGEEEDEEHFVLHTTYLDNPKSQSARYMETLKKRNYNRWKLEALGEWVSLDKLVYNNWREEEFDHTQIKGTLLCGLDFGFTNDTSAFICSILDEENKKIYVFKEWGGTGYTNDQLAKGILSLGFGKSMIIADSAEPKSIAELKKYGLYRVLASVKGKDSLINGISKLQEYEIIVHPSCVETITELENYTFQKDRATGEYINKPIDMFNHYLDALRYSLQCVKGGIKMMDKALLGL